MDVWRLIRIKGVYMKSDTSYTENGIKVTILPTYAPRKDEKTFTATRYTIANMGRKQFTVKSKGYKGHGLS